MNATRLVIVGLVSITVAFAGASHAEAQYFGGYGYGAGSYGGYYGGYGSGAYPTNNWYVSPYSMVSPGYVGSYGQGFGYTTNYGIWMPGYGTSYGIGAYGPGIIPNPIYGTTTTIIRGGPTGGVIEYSDNGNGYTYVPDSTYPTVIQQQPTLGLSRTYIPPSPPPVIVESRPRRSTAGRSVAPTPQPPPVATRASAGTIKLICPKSAGGSLTYSLNGAIYTIQPGYSQSFQEDRAWTLEFKRGGEDSEIARYSLKAGTYAFVVGANGWDIQQPGQAPPVSDLPPAPLPDLSPAPLPGQSPVPLPDLSTTPAPAVPPSPLPPQ